MGNGGNGSLRFGDYELDSHSGRLLRDGRPVKIQPQPLRVLSVLVERPGQIVSREQLQARIWGEATFVEFDQGLNYCIRQIRLALRDEASDPVYIETLPKQGYRFIAPITGNGHTGDSALPAVEDESRDDSFAALITPPLPKQPHWKILGAAIIALALAAAGILFGVRRRPALPPPAPYTQITSFTDAAVAPALSPDGRIVAFFRSDRKFSTAGQIYVKMLPDGEPVQLTHDPRLKYNLAFSPDGSRIAYTVENGWDTYTVSSLGGDSKLFLSNAAGLTWLDEHRLLFSEIKTGVHMGIVTAREDRSEHRDLYFPAAEGGMAHYSYASPDRKWVLAVEMDPVWQPCRLIPLAGGSPGKQVGPSGACTSAAWSPDGAWMYFGAQVDGRRHLWRQRFPDGQPKQITSGSTEEDGLAMAPDGRSLITSISTKQNAIWIHDATGDHALSTEGYADDATPPWFSSDGKHLYYLLRHDSPDSPNELWRANRESGRSEVVIPGLSMREYDITEDEKEVVFTIQPAGKAAQLWLAPLDRSEPPRMIAASGADSPHFGPDGQVLFRLADGPAYYLGRMARDGSDRAKIFSSPIAAFRGISRDRRFALLGLPYGPEILGRGHEIAFPVEGGPVRNLCDGSCNAARWSPDGKLLTLWVPEAASTRPAYSTVAIPVPAGQSLPALPAQGISLGPNAPAVPGIKVINQASVAPGLGSTYAYVKATEHANLFRIPLRQ